MIKSKTFEQSVLRSSFCINHNQIIRCTCSCGDRLCSTCISDHSHNNMYFQNEQENIDSFYKELEELLNLISEHEEKINEERKSFETCFKTENIKMNEIQSIKGLKEKISKIAREPFKNEGISSYFKQNLKEKILNLIIQHYKKKTNSKINLVNKMVSDYISNNQKHSKEASNSNSNIVQLSNSNKQANMNSSSGTIYLSNKENISPSNNSKKILNNKHIIITNFTTKFNEDLINKQITGDLSRFNLEASFYPKQYNTILSNDVLKIGNICYKENLFLNFKYGNNNEFLGSNESKSEDSLKVMCITCRERFTVKKDEVLWKRRCKVCSDNYKFN